MKIIGTTDLSIFMCRSSTIPRLETANASIKNFYYQQCIERLLKEVDKYKPFVQPFQ